MGKYCRICHRDRPNEAFNGKGHKIGICKKCSQMPKTFIQDIEDRDFICNVFHNQTNISKVNIARLNEIARRDAGSISEDATLIAEVAEIHPHRKRRIGKLYHNHRELFNRLVQSNFIEDYISPMIEDELYCEECFSRFESCQQSEDLNIRKDNEDLIFEDFELPF